ncbi:ABC-type nitrate/sulfonate/bicarbonate transport systems, periplasmic components [Paraburkholderia unamae]|uniref:ABC transporter substrate-binding protein n=1 Tax=Paraburkholderia unamae TaxID=219649 RepID=UPI001CB0C592|nr:ABC transporter substrate-binding protein [Paraburkholderia unamae]CAG9265679.1 ABC-type nitrate/sulfonate/bicarbonate transport systems, periplasmic components [Paraburkholderia unamae]
MAALHGSSPTPPAPNGKRRKWLRAAGATTLSAPVLTLGRKAWSAPPLKPFTFAWAPNGFCLTPVAVAQEQGFFEKNGLKVNLVSYAGSNDQLLQTLSTGKADAAVGMIHRWLKPLEAGFDVKIISSVHGGCVRLIGASAAGVTSLASLKGKTVGVSDLASPGKNFFAILLLKHGIDPDRDVSWRQYPADLLDVAVQKGEIQAIADGDPNLYLLERQRPGAYTHLASNLSDEYAHKVCCVIAARGSLLRSDRATAASLARALIQATDFSRENPREAAKSFAKYTPKFAEDDLVKLYASLTYDHHPTNVDLQQEIAYFAEDFKRAGVLKPTTDPQRFAAAVYTNVLG